MRQRILVIEDDSDINDLLKRILTGAGYDVLQSYSGTEALLLLKTATPDLILSDLMLPGMSGEQVLAKLRGEPGSDIPVIILSAKDGITDKVGLLDGGADDYITKPFAPDEVLARAPSNMASLLPPVRMGATNSVYVSPTASVQTPFLSRGTPSAS